MTSPLRFAGKVTLRSTNAEGARRYLTPGTLNGLTFPWMKAAEAGDSERVILYTAEDGDLRIEMDDQSFLMLVPELGFVSSSRSQSDAQRMRWSNGGGSGPGPGPDPEPGSATDVVKLEIWDPATSSFKTIRYSVNILLPYLVVDIGAARAQGVEDAPVLTSFERVLVTPSLDAIQKSKDARGVDLRKVDLTGADLSGVDLTGADLRGAILDRADFRGAQLTGACLADTSLLGTDFRGATFDQADLSGIDLSKAVFDSRVKALGTDFSESVMVGVSMAAPAGTTGADLSGADFTGTELAFADLTGAVLRSASLLRANLTGAVLGGVDFTGAQLGGLDQSLAANLSFTYLPNAIFSQANLFGVSFAFATLFGAAVNINDTSTLEQADFSNAYLAGIDLSGAVLSGSRFDAACLVNVSFVGADLTATLKGSVRTSLAGAVLYGAKFQGAKLGGADLTSAAVAFERGFFPVRYCAANGKPFPIPPSSQPTAHRETTGIDATTLGPETICPNGLQWGKRGSRTLEEMLTIPDPPDSWFPVACRPGKNVPAAGL